ncbi:MAG TPA: glycosyltransferase family 4 protein, partial [Candidatus Micrarchaeota archaeon]|nr:glycosyltransferase family 4 protein [Candidatus Micrarchaeota archaeon]
SPSRDEARALTGAYGANPYSVFVVPRGFDPSIFKPSGRSGVANPKSPSILCANVVRMQKNQHIFVPLALDLKKRGLEPLITLVGQNGDTHNRLYNDYATRLREMIKENGLAGNFRFVPPMPQEELGTVMQQCDIAIIPSIAETFGKSALESMASGMPTIAFKDVKAYSEFMDDGKTGLLVEREAGALAYAVERLSEDASLYSTMSAAGIGRGREFSWDNVMRVFYDNIKTRIFG